MRLTSKGTPAQPSQIDGLAAATIRACDPYREISLMARKMSEELDDITLPVGVPREISQEDSLVTLVSDLVAAGDAR